jgi:hypothetical protein
VTTIKVKGQEVRVGDDLWFLSTPHRITRIEPYRHPAVTLGEDWRIAYSDGPDGMYKAAWGMTLSFDHGYAAGYEVTLAGDDKRGEPHLAEDDYPSPHYGEGAELYPEYARVSGRLSWREWLAARETAGT